MDTRIKNYVGLVSILALIVLIISAFWYVSAYSDSTMPTATFSVTGEGKAVSVPDVALVSLGVLTEGDKDVAALQRENTEKANKISQFLKDQQEIAAEDIQTQSYNISPRYRSYACRFGGNGVTPCPPSEIVGYTINQSFKVKVRDLNKVGEVLSGVVALGANNVSGPNFTIDNPIELENEARGEAIAAAKEKAETMAKAGSFRLGRLISLYEQGLPYYPMSAKLEGYGVGGGAEFAAPDIEPGSEEVMINVVLTYEIR